MREGSMFAYHSEQIEKFIECDDKPDWCNSVDCAVIVYLMTLAGETGTCGVRMVKIALCTGGGSVNWKGTRASLRRLEEHGWISVERTPSERQNYTVHFDRIPPNPQGGYEQKQT
jgi:hypothetical protein